MAKEFKITSLRLADLEKELNFDYYYNDDLSLSEIAENEGITRQGVRDQIKRAEQTLFSLEEKCGYCRRFLRLKELSELAKTGDGAAIKEITDIIEEL